MACLNSLDLGYGTRFRMQQKASDFTVTETLWTLPVSSNQPVPNQFKTVQTRLREVWNPRVPLSRISEGRELRETSCCACPLVREALPFCDVSLSALSLFLRTLPFLFQRKSSSPFKERTLPPREERERTLPQKRKNFSLKGAQRKGKNKAN